MCGFCSTEQPLGDRCSACDKRLASSARKGISGRSTRFWEVRLDCPPLANRIRLYGPLLILRGYLADRFLSHLRPYKAEAMVAPDSHLTFLHALGYTI